jgi:3'-phosphoadenosine 5'-phosphosulfate sulfotransferase (PAPS reductase)/FAD synthetase
MDNKRIVCWWSGGVTSAVGCKVALDLFGKENCRVVMIDTQNEDEDTYRFKKDCEHWYGKSIEIITELGKKYQSIQDVWTSYESLNVATGAICSTELKRKARERWQKENEYDYQVFGFEFDKSEFNRALGLAKIKKANGIFPLMMMGYDKDDCLRIIQDAGIEVPRMYKLGFRNNNCFKTGCVQGGIGYWQKMKREFPDKFDAMAEMEHKLTDLRGEPVTMLKDQSNEAKKIVEQTKIKWKHLVFLKKHPNYPELKCLDDMKLQEVKPLLDCNGFCGLDVLTPKNETRNEINYQSDNF